MNIDELIKEFKTIECKMSEVFRTVDTQMSEVSGDIRELHRRVEEEWQYCNSERKFEYVKDFCNKYLFCSDSFVTNVTNEPEYDKSCCKKSSSQGRTYTHIDPEYFVQYINSMPKLHPAVYNRMHSMIKVSEQLKELATKAGIVNELL